MDSFINEIVNIDCLIGLEKIESDSIDLVITSPPYNLGIPYDDNSKRITTFSSNTPGGVNDCQRQAFAKMN